MPEESRRAIGGTARAWSLRIDTLQANAPPCAYLRARLFDPTEEAGIGLKPILEPVILSLEADQQAGRFAVARDDDLLCLGFGTNLMKQAGSGELRANVVRDDRPQGLEVLGLDTGPGMADIGRCMADGYSTADGPGTGLEAIARVSPDTDVFSLKKGGFSLKKGGAVLARPWPDERKRRAFEEPEINAVVISKPAQACSCPSRCRERL